MDLKFELNRTLALLHASFLPSFQFFSFFLSFLLRSRSRNFETDVDGNIRAVSSETSSTREMSQPESPSRHAITALREIAVCGLYTAPMDTIFDFG